MDYKLIYVNKLGYNYKGHSSLEFLFCDNTIELDDVWGDGWSETPANGQAQPPELDCIQKVGIIQLKDYDMDVASDSLFYSYCDAKDDVIALAWEVIDENFDTNQKRLVFRFGDTLESVEKQLGGRKLKINYEE